MTAKRPVRKRLAFLPFRYKKWLLCGRPYALIFLEAKRARAMWDTFGEIVTQRHIAKRPGTRPANWWRYSAPERWNSASETQLQFLTRLNLLSAEEQARVSHVRPRLRRSSSATLPLPPVGTRPLSNNSTAPAQPLSPPKTTEKGYQLVLVNDRVQLVHK